MEVVSPCGHCEEPGTATKYENMISCENTAVWKSLLHVVKSYGWFWCVSHYMSTVQGAVGREHGEYLETGEGGAGVNKLTGILRKLHN